MAKYGTVVYGGSKYGVTPRLAYSVEPMSIETINFTEVYVYWQPPTGTFSKIRLVRNQVGFPETAEDGVIVWEQTLTPSQIAQNITSLTNVNKTYLFDGEENKTTVQPITPGGQVYYRMFLFTSAKVWVIAGSISDTVPSDHNSSLNFVNALPRVFTSAEQSPLSEVDTTSPLYSFLNGMGFTYDELLTYLDLLLPSHSALQTPTELIPLQTVGLGLTQEPGLPVKNQKKLIREALYMYFRKGTRTAIQTFVEAMTSYPATLTTSQNLLLNVQDSTFYNSVGNWTATNTTTFAAATDQVPSTSVTTTINGLTFNPVIDTQYACKIIATGAGSMTLGLDNPILKGVPVTPGTTYTLSAQVKSPPSSGSITPAISYYDLTGTIIGSAHAGSAHAATNSWSVASVTYAAPAAAQSSVATLGTITGGTGYTNGTYTGVTLTTQSGTNPFISPVATVVVSGGAVTNVTITNSGAGVDTTTVLTASSSVLGSGGLGFSVPVATVNPYTSGGTYAGITLSWSAAGTYYVDMVCLQSGSSVAYDEARAIDVFLNPNKTNLIKNPSFETNFTDWTSTGFPTLSQSTDVTPLAYSGIYSGKIVASGAWSLKSNTSSVTTGVYYTTSAFAKSSSQLLITMNTRDSGGTIVDTYTAAVPGDVTTTITGASGATTITVGDATNVAIGQSVNGTGIGSGAVITGLNGTAATLSVPNSDNVSGTGTFTNPWERYIVTFPVPVSSTATTIETIFSGTSATTAYIDCVQLEQSPVATEYFDGSLPSDFGAVWAGTAHDSYSYVYFSKPSKVPRLARTINDWVPNNAFWRVRTYAGVEYTNLTV